MSCKIIKDKTTGEEYLIPDCYGVISRWGDEGMTDREIIKTYCHCNRKRREKYEVHTRDEVIVMLEKLETKIIKTKQELAEMEQELDGIKSEVFMLNTVEVFNPKK